MRLNGTWLNVSICTWSNTKILVSLRNVRWKDLVNAFIGRIFCIIVAFPVRGRHIGIWRVCPRYELLTSSLSHCEPGWYCYAWASLSSNGKNPIMADCLLAEAIYRPHCSSASLSNRYSHLRQISKYTVPSPPVFLIRASVVFPRDRFLIRANLCSSRIAANSPPYSLPLLIGSGLNPMTFLLDRISLLYLWEIINVYKGYRICGHFCKNVANPFR